MSASRPPTLDNSAAPAPLLAADLAALAAALAFAQVLLVVVTATPGHGRDLVTATGTALLPAAPVLLLALADVGAYVDRHVSVLDTIAAAALAVAAGTVFQSLGGGIHDPLLAVPLRWACVAGALLALWALERRRGVAAA